MSDDRLVVGIDLGGTHMQVGVVRADGEILAREGTLTHAERGPDAVVETMGETVRTVCAAAGVEPGDLASIGIGAPGAIDLEARVVLEAPNLGWTQFPVAERLSALLDGKDVVIDNDVNAALYGELRLGAARDVSDAFGVWIGTGVGGAIAIDNKLYHGALGTAGEIGRTILFPAQPNVEERIMEANCSRQAITRRLMGRLERGEVSVIKDYLGGTLQGFNASHLARAYAENDDLARRVVNRAADLLGMSIANTMSVLSIPVVVLGGGLTEALGEVYVRRVAASMRKCIFPSSIGNKIQVRMTALAENAGLLGAAMLALDSERTGDG